MALQPTRNENLTFPEIVKRWPAFATLSSGVLLTIANQYPQYAKECGVASVVLSSSGFVAWLFKKRYTNEPSQEEELKIVVHACELRSRHEHEDLRFLEIAATRIFAIFESVITQFLLLEHNTATPSPDLLTQYQLVAGAKEALAELSAKKTVFRESDVASLYVHRDTILTGAHFLLNTFAPPSKL